MNSLVKVITILVLSFLMQELLLGKATYAETENIDRKIDSLIDSSVILAEANLLDSALYILQIAEKLLDKKVGSTNYAKVLFNTGYAFDYNGSLDTALQYYNRAEEIFVDLNDKVAVAKCLNYKGGALYFSGDLDKALIIYLDGLDYTEEYNLKETQLQILNNLGVIYRASGKNKQAIDIYKQTLLLSKAMPDENMIGASYHNLGVAYGFDKNVEDALIYFDSALTQYTLLKDSLEMGRTANAIGAAYYMNEKDKSIARTYLLQGEVLLSKFNNQEVLSNTYLTLGNIERDFKNYAQSKLYFQKGLELLEGTERNEQLMDYYKAIESLYTELEDFPKAHGYLSKYLTLFEELRASEKTTAVEELQTKYETEKKENQIALLNSRNEIQLTILKARRNGLLVLGLGASLLLFFLAVVYRLNQKLKTQNFVIAEALDDKDTLLREIHHRVKNNLQLVSGLLVLQSDHIDDLQAVNALKDSEARVQSIALLHQDLYINDSLRDVNSEDYLLRLIDNLNETFNTEERNIQLVHQIQSMILDVETMIPMGLIVNELVTNSLKHAFSANTGGLINVTLMEEEECLLLVVEDNGRASETFQLSNKSFGYTLIQYFVTRLDAELTIDRKNGLRVELRIRGYNENRNSIINR